MADFIHNGYLASVVPDQCDMQEPTYIRSYAEVFRIPTYSMLSFMSACLHCLPHRNWRHLLPLSKATSRSWRWAATGTWTRSNQSECSLRDPQCDVVEAHSCVEISLDGQYTTVDNTQ